MIPDVLKEFYNVRGCVVTVVMTRTDRKALQAWAADPKSQSMERHDEFIPDVLDGSGEPLDIESFVEFCEANQIDTNIPHNKIALSVRLSKIVPANSAVNTVPVPTYKIA